MVLGSLPVQAKTRLYSISGIASTARVMTQGEIASTAYGRPQALFLQNFRKRKSVKIAHKGTIPLTPSLNKKSTFRFIIHPYQTANFYEDKTTATLISQEPLHKDKRI